MKKKIIYLLLICLITLTCTGCFESDELKGSNITTTVYPIEYIVTRLYDDGKITSIYPNDTDVTNYKLTDKQLNDIAKSTMIFVYNGSSDEKEIAKALVNKNKDIQPIGASYNYKYGVEELWLSPNNYLMMADNIKTRLKELSTSKYAADEIEKNYASLEEDLSTLDANLRNIASSAKNNDKGTIIIAYNSLGFLEKYGFDVINISSENNITTSIKNKFKNKTYKYIFVDDKNNVSDSVKDLVDNYNAELVEVNTMSTLTDEERSNNDNYLTIMKDFINNLSNIVLSEEE